MESNCFSIRVCPLPPFNFFSELFERGRVMFANESDPVDNNRSLSFSPTLLTHHHRTFYEPFSFLFFFYSYGVAQQFSYLDRVEIRADAQRSPRDALNGRHDWSPRKVPRRHTTLVSVLFFLSSRTRDMVELRRNSFRVHRTRNICIHKHSLTPLLYRSVRGYKSERQSPSHVSCTHVAE